MYARLLGGVGGAGGGAAGPGGVARGAALLRDETKWLAVTHKTFDQGKRGFNERLAFYGETRLGAGVLDGRLMLRREALGGNDGPEDDCGATGGAADHCWCGGDPVGRPDARHPPRPGQCCVG
jgi:hypothetical protein